MQIGALAFLNVSVDNKALEEKAEHHADELQNASSAILQNSKQKIEFLMQKLPMDFLELAPCFKKGTRHGVMQ